MYYQIENKRQWVCFIFDTDPPDSIQNSSLMANQDFLFFEALGYCCKCPSPKNYILILL